MPMTREDINAKRKADPEYNAKVLAKRRAAKARARARKKALKAPRTHCRSGLHLLVEGARQCEECRKARAKQYREAQSILKAALRPAKPIAAPALTSAEQRALAPVTYRNHERECEARYLGKPVVPWAVYLVQKHAAANTPEAVARREALRKAAYLRVKAKLQAARPPKTHCKNGHPRTPENWTGSKCIVCAALSHKKHNSKSRARSKAKHRTEILNRKGYVIYALVDPRGPEVFYIGCTVQPKQRLQKHTRRSESPKVRERVAELKALGLVPSIVILEHTKDVLREQVWIEFFGPWGIVNDPPYTSRSAYHAPALVRWQRMNLQPTEIVLEEAA